MKRLTIGAAAFGACLTLALSASPVWAQAATVIAPGVSLPLCTAIQTAAWNATDEAWDRTKLRPGQMMCSLTGVEGYCVSNHCRAEAGIVILPPVSIANPTAQRYYGKIQLGRTPTAADIQDRYPNVERATFSKDGMTTIVSVSSKDPAYAKQLMAAIRKGVK